MLTNLCRAAFELGKIPEDCHLPGLLPAGKFWPLRERCVIMLPMCLHLGTSLQVTATHTNAWKSHGASMSLNPGPGWGRRWTNFKEALNLRCRPWAWPDFESERLFRVCTPGTLLASPSSWPCHNPFGRLLLGCMFAIEKNLWPRWSTSTFLLFL